MKYRTKVEVWMIKQAVWGSDRPAEKFFRTKEESDDYYETHNYCTQFPPTTMDLFDEYGERRFYFEDELNEYGLPCKW